MNKEKNPPYLKKYGDHNDIAIWIVDGAYIRKNFDEEFSNLGQHYHYNFIPEKEFWVEKESEHNEIRFFIDHLLVEYELMKKGVPYKKALTEAEKAEKKERHRANYRRDHTGSVLGIGKIKPDPASAHEKLWQRLASGVKVWLVNGERVRSVFDIEFTEGGHHEVYDYVPEGEVWIDDAVKPQERSYILLHEMHELKLMEKGVSYDKAHAECSKLESYYRHHPSKLKDALEVEEKISEKD